MTDPKLEKKIEKLLNYKCLNYLSGNNKYKSKSSTPNHSSLKDTPNTDRSDSKSNKHYPVIVEKHHKNSSLATNYSDLPYIKETRNNFDKKKQLHSYNNSVLETNITEEAKINEKKSSNNVNQFNSKMTGLMQFKTISKELNGNNSNVVIQRPHRKKPEFSMDFSTQANDNISKSNVLSNNTTKLRVITENSLIKSNNSKRNENPVKIFNTNNDMIVKQRDKLEPINNVKRTNNYKLTLKKAVNKDLNKILPKKDNEEVKNQPIGDESPKAPLEHPDDDRKYYGVGIRRSFHCASSLNKVRDTMKTIINKSLSSIDSVQNPYAPIKDTLNGYYIHLNDSTEEDDEYITEMFIDNKFYSNPFPSSFRYYEFTHPECKYILNRYFDCFDELITDFIDSTTTTKKVPIHFDLRRRLSQVPLLKRVDTFDNHSDFDLKNQDYIFRYILKSTTNWYSRKINMKTSTDPKKKPIIKRSSIRLSLQFSEKHKPSQVFKFKRAKTKLEDYNVFTHKQNLQVVYDKSPEGKYIRSKTHRVTLTMKELSAEEIWNLLLNDIFYNKKNHFMELYIKNINNIDINRQDDRGNTLLIYSTQNNASDIVEFLLEKGCDPNSQNMHGNTALHYAISHKHFPISNLLIKYNASERIRNHLGLMPWECLNKDCENAI